MGQPCGFLGSRSPELGVGLQPATSLYSRVRQTALHGQREQQEKEKEERDKEHGSVSLLLEYFPKRLLLAAGVVWGLQAYSRGRYSADIHLNVLNNSYGRMYL